MMVNSIDSESLLQGLSLAQKTQRPFLRLADGGRGQRFARDRRGTSQFRPYGFFSFSQAKSQSAPHRALAGFITGAGGRRRRRAHRRSLARTLRPKADHGSGSFTHGSRLSTPLSGP